MYWKLKRRGKVRDIYESIDGEYIALVATNRVSAFDRMLPVIIENKGIMITELSEFFMDLTKDVIPNAQLFYYGNERLYEEFSIETGIDMECVTIQKKLTMLPIECIVRLYLTGSAWRKYAKGEREKCGVIMPDGLHESERFPEILFTPTTKNDSGEDEDITFSEMVDILDAAGYDGINLANKIKQYSIMNANMIADYCDAHGLILADIKTEFGVDEDGNVYMSDENGTFDSSRFADKDAYEVGKPLSTYDKEIIRQHLLEQEKAGIENPVPSLAIINYSITRYKELMMKLGIYAKWNLEKTVDNCSVYTSADGKYTAYVLECDSSDSNSDDGISISPNEACAAVQITEACVEYMRDKVLSDVENPAALIDYFEDEDLYQEFEASTGKDIDYVRIEHATTPLPILCIANFTKNGDPETQPEIYFLSDVSGESDEVTFTAEEVAVEIDKFLADEEISTKEAGGKAIAELIHSRVKRCVTIMSGYYAECGMTVLMACFEFGISEEGEVQFIGEIGTIDSATVAKCTEDDLEEISSNETIADLLGIFSEEVVDE